MIDKVKRCIKDCREWYKVFCIFGKGGVYSVESLNIAADLIEFLAAELEQVKRERDAAVKDIYSMKACALCKHYPSGEECETYFLLCNECDNENCICKECVDGKKMEWRGAKMDLEV